MGDLSTKNYEIDVKPIHNLSSTIHCSTNTEKSQDQHQLIICNVNDIQKQAKKILPKALYEYLASGTDDEQTLAENISSFKTWYLRPRVMRPISKLDTKTSILGQTLSMPLFISPAGVHSLCDNQHGECATARACGSMGTLFGLSQHSTRSIEDVAREAPGTNKWFQCYILKDREITKSLVTRAVKAGYRGIFLTVDSVRFGFREADKRNSFDSLPPPHRLVNYDDHEQGSSFDKTYNAKKYESWDQNTELMFETNLSWDDVRWLKYECCNGLPLIVKGIMTAECATMALESGADGIMVSNHGGRQLDGALSSIDALPSVVKAVAGKVPILLDGGIRRGTDIVKAIALGATAVGVGKPVFFSLALGGEDWVVMMLQMLKKELESAMALCGCESIQDINSNLICQHPFHHKHPYIRSSLLSAVTI